ncbi:MAG: DUF5615 family PIN-like protein [Planctomycetales bacterium]
MRLLADENFNGDIVRGFLLRRSTLDLVRVQDVGLSGTDDSGILEWAAEDERILLTHDRATMPKHAYERMIAGGAMAGMFVLDDQFPTGAAIDAILLVVDASDPSEWSGIVAYLPL